MFKSDLTGKNYPEHQKVGAHQVRPEILQKIKEENPQFTDQACLSVSELNEYRNRYIGSLLEREVGTLSELEKEVLDALHKK